MAFFDLLGDAIKKAQAELEKNVDNVLGIEGSGSKRASETGGQALADGKPSSASSAAPKQIGEGESQAQHKPDSKPAASAPTANAPLDQLGSAGSAELPPVPPAPGGEVKKKIIKKVIKKKVVRSSDAAPAAPAEGEAAPPAEGALGPGQQGAPASSGAAVDTVPAEDALHQLLSEAASEHAQPSMPAAAKAGHAAAEGAGSSAEPRTISRHARKPSQDIPSLNGHAPHKEEPQTPVQTKSRSSHAGEVSSEQAHTHATHMPAHAEQPQSASQSEPAADGWDTGPADLLQPESAAADPAAPPATHAQSIAPAPPAPSIALPDNLEQMGTADLVLLVQQVHASMSSREEQLLRQAEQMSQLQQVVAQFQEKNEELALKSAKISEQDWEEMRTEFEQRLAAAERKVYALTKERDALKRGNEKLADYSSLLKEKDGIIKQVMEEGEKLASKQADLEGIIKKLRQQLGGVELERDKLSSKLSNEEASSEALRKAKAKTERDLAAAQEQAKADLDAQRQQYEALLQKAKLDQAESEERAREAVAAGTARKVKELEARCEALGETVVELREALDRQRQAADLREEMLKQDLSDLERRCQAAELRHQELAAKLPDATRPLLRQIEAMQSAAEAQGDAWSAAERTLNTRIADAEGRCAAAMERERLTAERTQVLSTKVAGLEAALSAARTEVKGLHEELESSSQVQASLQEQLRGAQHAAELATERARLAAMQLEQADAAHSEALAAERSARIAAESDAATVRKECDRRMAELESQLAEAAANAVPGGFDEPPAMAAPGYRWVLQKEGESVSSGPSGSHALPGTSSGAGHGGHVEHNMHGGASQLQHLQQHSDSTASGGAGHHSSLGHHGAGGGPGGLGGGGGGGGGELQLPSVPPHVPMSAGGSGHAAGGMPLASELENMRAALRIKSGEVASLEAQVRALEMTRDRLAEELVAAAQKSEQASEVLNSVDRLKAEMDELRTRYVAAVELLGERDEALEELRADLMDVKNLYREQIEFMCEQLAGLHEERQRQHHPVAHDGLGAA